MSEIPPPPPTPPGVRPPAQRSGCLTAFMIIAGLILLLPGLCAAIFGLNEFTTSSTDPVVTVLVLIGLGLGGLGIGMIWRAVRGRTR
jgi:drug/metabolite transporter (DMT)-like permease